MTSRYTGASECPLRTKSYGGLPGGMIFQPWREVGIGAQRASEALHCILGSLDKVVQYVSSQDHPWSLEEAFSIEQGHITEELEIIEQSVWEYGKTVWTDQINKPPSARREQIEAADEQVRNFQKDGPRLVKIAERELENLQDQTDLPEPVVALAEKCYFAAIALGKASEKSSAGWPDVPFYNPLSSRTYVRAVEDLKKTYVEIYPDGIEWLRQRRNCRYGSRDEWRDTMGL